MPSSSSLKLTFVLAALSMFTVVVGCAESPGNSIISPDGPNSSIAPVGDDDPNPTESPTQPAPVTTSTLEPVDETEQAAVEIMWRMIGRFGDANKGAVIEAGHNGHRGLIPVLVEAAARTFDPDLAGEIANSLEKITGATEGGNFVLLAHPDTGVLCVFESSEDLRLTGTDDPRAFTDRDRSEWTVTESSLVSDSGEILERVPAREMFWFAWSAFFPNTRVYPDN